MKLVLSLVFAFVISTAPSLALAWPASGGKRAASEKSCEIILQLTIFDENVHPPFFHVTKWIELLAKDKSHRLTNQKANVLTVATTKPNDLMKLAGRSSMVQQVTQNGQTVPLYYDRRDATIDEEVYDRNQRQHFYNFLAHLPEGAYDLVDIQTKNPVTMFIHVKSESRRARDPLTSLSLSIEVWPGEHELPQSEEFFREKMIASVTSISGVDYFAVDRHPKGFIVASSFGEAFGGPDEIKFNLGNREQLLSIETKGRVYKFAGIRPLRNRTSY